MAIKQLAISEKEKVSRAIISLLECTELNATDIVDTLLTVTGTTLQALDLTGATVKGATGSFTVTVKNK